MPRSTKTEIAKSAALKAKPTAKPPTSGKVWSPGERDWAWYHERVVEHETFAAIGKKSGVSRERVFEVVGRVRQWLQAQLHDDIMAWRVEQTDALQHVAREAFAAWKRSVGKHTVETVKKGDDGTETTTKTEDLAGNPSFLAEYRAALADIRKIWGVDSAKKLDVQAAFHAPDLERVAGKTRSQAIRDQANAMLAAAEAADVESDSAA